MADATPWMPDPDTIDPAGPYREAFGWPFDDSGGHPRFYCGMCGTDQLPCADHAPRDIPGLRRVECTADHDPLWALDRDDYGHGCPLCWVAQQRQRIDELTRCRHWPWRRWRITRWVLHRLPVSFGSVSGGPDHNGCAYGFRWRWGR